MDNFKPATGEPQNPQVIQPTNVALGVAVGIGVAFVFGMGGFLLVKDDTGSMGAVLFLLLPFAAGFGTALVARRWNIVVASLIIGFVICSTILLVSKMEGWVCVLMSFPLIAIGMTVGALLGTLVRRQFIDKSRRPRVVKLVLLLVIPVFLMGADNIEKPSRRIPREETFTSVLVLNAPPEKVWNTIKIMDRVNGHKGFLMRIGLPVPVSCSIDKEGLGGKRTCYFESGYIEERITEWDPPRSMKLAITAWDVPGRPWLDFKDASYEFHEDNGQTIMTRTTTIVSRLLPAWYWRRFEEIGVKTEHEYLFEAVKNEINGEK
jgi:hypothetical protein